MTRAWLLPEWMASLPLALPSPLSWLPTLVESACNSSPLAHPSFTYQPFSLPITGPYRRLQAGPGAVHAAGLQHWRQRAGGGWLLVVGSCQELVADGLGSLGVKWGASGSTSWRWVAAGCWIVTASTLTVLLIDQPTANQPTATPRWCPTWMSPPACQLPGATPSSSTRLKSEGVGEGRLCSTRLETELKVGG